MRIAAICIGIEVVFFLIMILYIASGFLCSLPCRESKVKVDKGTFENLRHLKLEEWTRALGEDVIKEKASKIPVSTISSYSL